VYGLGPGLGLGCRVEDLSLRVYGLGPGLGLGCRVEDLSLRVYGSVSSLDSFLQNPGIV
jgi:hypothetical protein